MSDATKRWYVIQARSGKEETVVKMLTHRANLEGMEYKFEEIVVPTEEVVEMRAGVKHRSERKFFPGYVLVRMEMDDQT